MISIKRRPTWACDIIREAERYGAPEGSKRQRIYSNYVALMSNLVDEEPTCFEVASKKKEWMKAMIEEYQSIIKNDFWDVIPIPNEKSIVCSKQIFMTKHSADGSIEKFKAKFFSQDFSQKERIDYEENFAPVARYRVYHICPCNGSHDEMEATSNGCENNFTKWSHRRRTIH